MSLCAETILRASGVSKIYARKPAAMRKRLAGLIWPAFTGRAPAQTPPPSGSEFWALKDISLELHRGQAIGVIGLNGSGKTTLLRILAGQISPDEGEVAINGTSAAMIDLQAGFQPSASGRVNIYRRAASIGFSRQETEAMVDEVIAFSELGDAIDAPMASYSSGMAMRLAFSVMAMAAPDILFIDEVLAVGDFRFRQKCLAKIREMRARSAFVFVSHSMGDVARFCDHVIVLHKGRVHFSGEPEPAIEVYESLDSSTVADGVDTVARAMGPTFTNDAAFEEIEHYWCDANGSRCEAAAFDEGLRLYVRLRPTHAIRKLIIGVPVWNVNAQYATGMSTEISSEPLDIAAGETVELMLEAAGGMVNPGVVKSLLTVLDGPEFLYRQPNPDLLIRNAAHPTWGAVTVPHRWRILSASGRAAPAAKAGETG